MTATHHFSGQQPVTLYDLDYGQWLEVTVAKLQQHDYTQVDWPHLIEELKDIGKRERRSLKSNLVVLLLHLMKWQYQPTQRTGTWAGSVVEHRRRIREALQDSPSLQPYLASMFAEAYQDAIKQAAAETGLAIATFPQVCEFALIAVMDEEF